MSIGPSGSDSTVEIPNGGVVPFLLRGVFLKGLPLGAFFAVFTLFPFSVNNPLEHVGQPIPYVITWAIIGLMLGYSKWTSVGAKLSRP